MDNKGSTHAFTGWSLCRLVRVAGKDERARADHEILAPSTIMIGINCLLLPLSVNKALSTKDFSAFGQHKGTYKASFDIG